MKRLLIVGGSGQLGRALQDAFAAWQPVVWSRPAVDLADPTLAQRVTELAPDLVINAAAWTQVDAAESDPAGAYAANALGPLYLAQGCAGCGATLVQVSTNEVFGGEMDHFYWEYDLPNPASVYARSKAAGERAARQLLDRLYVVRVAWLYGPGGNNFPTKIAQAADKFGALKVVADEFGNPTYAPDVANALVSLVQSQRYGIYHLVNEGWASRFAVAQQVMALSGRQQVALTPIGLADWPRPAPPPPHAVLVNQAAAALGIRLRPWQDALAEYMGLPK